MISGPGSACGPKAHSLVAHVQSSDFLFFFHGVCFEDVDVCEFLLHFGPN